MVVAHLINSLNQGGAERVLSRLVTAEARDGDPRHVVITLLPGGAFTPIVRAAGVEVHELGLSRERLDPRALPRLIHLLRAIRPDVLLTWLYQASLLGTLASASVPGTRLIWNIRGTAKDRSLTSRNSRLTVAALTRLSGLPWAVAVNSRAGRVDHEALGFRPRRWAYVPNGFAPEEWYPDHLDRGYVRGELGFPSDALVFTMVGRAEPQKDHATLLDAFAEVARQRKDAHLVLIGRETEHLNGLAALRSRVTAMGPRDDVSRLLRGCDIGVLSSAYGEGLPNAVAEKMLTGLPCVVTDTGDSARLVGTAGAVVPARDAAALAEGMLQLASLHPAEREALGQQGRRRVMSLYSMEGMVAGFDRMWPSQPDGTR